jgi:hypothetical protein
MSNYLIGMEEEGKLVYSENKKEYVPAGLTSRAAANKYRKQRVRSKRK